MFLKLFFILYTKFSDSPVVGHNEPCEPRDERDSTIFPPRLPEGTLQFFGEWCPPGVSLRGRLLRRHVLRPAVNRAVTVFLYNEILANCQENYF